MAHESENKAVIELAERLHEPKIININGLDENGDNATVPVVVKGGNSSMKGVKEFFDQYRTRPERHKGITMLDRPGSFVDFCNRHAPENSALYCSLADGQILAIFNGNEPTAEGKLGKTGFADYGARYDFPLSLGWQRWANVSGESISSEDLAEFLEINILDVMPVTPDLSADARVHQLGGKLAGPDKLFELAKGVKIFTSTETETKLNLASGEATLVAKESHHNDKGSPVKLPSLFFIMLPIFEGGEAEVVLVRLRYRMSGGRVRWTLLVHDADKLVAEAMEELADDISAKTSLPLFYGHNPL